MAVKKNPKRTGKENSVKKSDVSKRIVSLSKEIESKINKGKSEDAGKLYKDLLTYYKKMKPKMDLDDYVSVYRTITNLKKKIPKVKKSLIKKKVVKRSKVKKNAVKKPKVKRGVAEKKIKVKKKGHEKKGKIHKLKKILKIPKKLGLKKSDGEKAHIHEGYIETDIDMLYKMVTKNGMVNVKAAAKKFKVDREKIEEWGRILENHELIILHYPPFGDPCLILRKYKPEAKIKEGEKKGGVKGKRKNGKKPIVMNVVIILAFFLFVLYYTGRLPQNITDIFSSINIHYIRYLISGKEIYLAAGVIILIVLIVLVKVIRKRRKNKTHKKKPEKMKGKSGKK